MLSQKEVYDIMKEDILELQRKRIKELELALERSIAMTEVIHDVGAANVGFHCEAITDSICSLKFILKKGISL